MSIRAKSDQTLLTSYHFSNKHNDKRSAGDFLNITSRLIKSRAHTRNKEARYVARHPDDFVFCTCAICAQNPSSVRNPFTTCALCAQSLRNQLCVCSPITKHISPRPSVNKVGKKNIFGGRQSFLFRSLRFRLSDDFPLWGNLWGSTLVLKKLRILFNN